MDLEPETMFPAMSSRAAVLVAFAVMCGAQWLFASGMPWLGAAAVLAGWSCLGPVSRPEPGVGGQGARLGAGAAAVFLLALALRLWRLDEVPPVWWDEGVEGHDARCLAEGLPLEDLEGIYYHRGPLWLLLLSLAGRALGFSVFVLRAVAAGAGAALAAGAFVAGTRVFGLAGGIVAGIWLAIDPWALNMSRIMIGNILVPLAGVAIVLVCFNSRVGLVARATIAGTIAGASMYGYAAAAQLPALGAAALWLSGAGRARNRAVAAALSVAVAAAIAAKDDPDSVLAVMPSDHLIREGDAFRDAIRTAASAVAQSGIAVIGVAPTEPATGYGYIKPSVKGAPGAVPVLRFVEKPDESKAHRLIADGCLWNAGIFCFRAGWLLDALTAMEPEAVRLVGDAVRAMRVDLGMLVPGNAFSEVKTISLPALASAVSVPYTSSECGAPGRSLTTVPGSIARLAPTLTVSSSAM